MNPYPLELLNHFTFPVTFNLIFLLPWAFRETQADAENSRPTRVSRGIVPNAILLSRQAAQSLLLALRNEGPVHLERWRKLTGYRDPRFIARQRGLGKCE